MPAQTDRDRNCWCPVGAKVEKYTPISIPRGLSFTTLSIKVKLHTILEHTGTHCDAPAHFIDGGLFIDEIPLERLMGPGVTIDISQKVGSHTRLAPSPN